MCAPPPRPRHICDLDARRPHHPTSTDLRTASASCRRPPRAARSPRARSPRSRSPRARSPRSRSLRARSPRSRSLRARFLRVRSPRARSPRSRSLRARFLRVRSPRARSPRSRSARACAALRVDGRLNSLSVDGRVAASPPVAFSGRAAFPARQLAIMHVRHLR